MRLTGALLRLLHALPPETAHAAAIGALRHGLVPRADLPTLPRLATTLFGHELRHPLGMAAGFDKNAEATGGLFRLGFAFVEVGTITPRAQSGNPKPRLFRLKEDHALINRMGFNNRGVGAARAQLAARDGALGPIGANIGPNKDTEEPVRDYVACLEGLYELADYLVVNVSSPNTPGLRQLQGRAALGLLLDAVLEVRAGLAPASRPKPLLLKIAPDLTPEDEAAIAEVVLEKGVDGLIVSNTTTTRPPTLISPHRNEAGGLSGPPLFAPSTGLLARMFLLTGGGLPLIGVGGIATGEAAYAKIRAGASVLQLYTALIYRGPAVVRSILGGLDRLLAQDGFTSLADAVGVDARRYEAGGARLAGGS